jgi:hypothetical protein
MEWAVKHGLALESMRAGVCYAQDPHLHRLGDSEYWDFVVDSAPGRVVAVVWNGNQHNADFLIESRPPVRVATEQSDGTDTAAVTWVPQELLRARWRPTNDDLEQVLRRLVPVARQVLVVGTPPPKPDAFVSGVLHSEPHFVTVARELGLDPRDAPVTPGPTRLALWSVVQDMLADSAAATGATFVPVPDAAVDEDGYLREVLATSDATHANTAYAHLVWQAIADAIKGNDR